MVSYVEWVLEEALRSGKKRIYFLARDGWLMYQTAVWLSQAGTMSGQSAGENLWNENQGKAGKNFAEAKKISAEQERKHKECSGENTGNKTGNNIEYRAENKAENTTEYNTKNNSKYNIEFNTGNIIGENIKEDTEGIEESRNTIRYKNTLEIRYLKVSRFSHVGEYEFPL